MELAFPYFIHFFGKLNRIQMEQKGNDDEELVAQIQN